ncbi:hypothetical protein B0I21_10492 [Sphingobacterium paludis]|uniref:Uncharacterized protein n=1 Tax=Sphingobacterium paludis TaxID=1476465 RepID=A0A4R7D4H4_9SPHI|nr:hypothetical protein B0I21_10492 [Sphingobacterium paludis]
MFAHVIGFKKIKNVNFCLQIGVYLRRDNVIFLIAVKNIKFLLLSIAKKIGFGWMGSY